MQKHGRLACWCCIAGARAKFCAAVRQRGTTNRRSHLPRERPIFAGSCAAAAHLPSQCAQMDLQSAALGQLSTHKDQEKILKEQHNLLVRGLQQATGSRRCVTAIWTNDRNPSIFCCNLANCKPSRWLPMEQQTPGEFRLYLLSAQLSFSALRLPLRARYPAVAASCARQNSTASCACRCTVDLMDAHSKLAGYASCLRYAGADWFCGPALLSSLSGQDLEPLKQCCCLL